jgi:pentatricopeptide repeat protein
LPQSYAAVIQSFLRDGDVETAEAVYASNRRSGVSAAKSWTVITTALFNADMQERALQLVEQVRYSKNFNV